MHLDRLKYIAGEKDEPPVLFLVHLRDQGHLVQRHNIISFSHIMLSLVLHAMPFLDYINQMLSIH